jgi:hypothetical protein
VGPSSDALPADFPVAAAGESMQAESSVFIPDSFADLCTDKPPAVDNSTLAFPTSPTILHAGILDELLEDSKTTTNDHHWQPDDFPIETDPSVDPFFLPPNDSLRWSDTFSDLFL